MTKGAFESLLAIVQLFLGSSRWATTAYRRGTDTDFDPVPCGSPEQRANSKVGEVDTSDFFAEGVDLLGSKVPSRLP